MNKCPWTSNRRRQTDYLSIIIEKKIHDYSSGNIPLVVHYKRVEDNYLIICFHKTSKWIIWHIVKRFEGIVSWKNATMLDVF